MNTPKLFIHVGLHKTGTTYLQNFVFPYWVDVMYLGKPYHGKLFERAVSDTTGAVLMSHEQFSSKPIGTLLVERKQSMAEHRSYCLKRLNAFFPEAHILVSFREQSKFIFSLYHQYIRSGGIEPLENFWSTDGKDTVLGYQDMVFGNVIKEIRTLWSNVFVFDHQEISLTDMKLFSDMAAFFGVSTLPGARKGSPNKSFTFARNNVVRKMNLVVKKATGSENLLFIEKVARPVASILPLSGKVPEAAVQLKAKMENSYAEDWKFVQNAIAERREHFDKMNRN